MIFLILDTPHVT